MIQFLNISELHCNSTSSSVHNGPLRTSRSEFVNLKNLVQIQVRMMLDHDTN